MTILNSRRTDGPVTVFVTGASGLIGKSVVRALLDRDMFVRALVRSGMLPVSSPKLTIIKGDIRNESDVRRAAVGATHVIHLAALKADEPQSEAVNVEGTNNVLQAAKEQNIALFLHVSTPSAALRTAGTYGQTKNRAEESVKASGVPFVIVRPSVVYADVESGILGSIRKFLNLPVVPVIGSGTVTFAPIHADDLGVLFLKLLTEERVIGGTFDAGGPVLTFNEMIAETMDALSIKKPVVHLPVWFASLLATIFSLLPKPPITKSNVRGATETVTLDLQKLQTIVPYETRTLREALRTFSNVTGAGFLPADKQEADVLLRYVLRSVDPVPPPDQAEKERYALACTVHEIDATHHVPAGVTLSMMDASTKIFAPHCTLQKKLLIAAAIAETSTRSAPFLLPKNRSVASIVLQLAFAGVHSIALLIGGLCLKLLFPSSWNTHAGV